MTAEVAILNTHGIALAADSAVTITVSNEKKVYNTANKLFALSKYHPVGIMFYNKATYMEIDWEIIIKEYRKIIKDKSFSTLFEYAANFIDFVNNYHYIKEENEKRFLTSIYNNIILSIKENFFKKLLNDYAIIKDIPSEDIIKILNLIINEKKISIKNKNEQYYTLDLNFIIKNKEDIFLKIEKEFEKFNILPEQKENIYQIILSEINNKKYMNNFSGIVIAGYGDNEIFPSIYKCEIYGKIGESFIKLNEEKDSISFTRTAIIAPYAQTEMVHSFMCGIDPYFKNNINEKFESIILTLIQKLGDSYKNILNEVKDTFLKDIIRHEKEIYIDPIMEIVQSLQKLDLAEMAETLVNLTAFKRHISKDAETVGGPTDVVVLTKGDGFVWIKRKHYFDIKLNRFFQQNYYTEGIDE